MSTANIRFSLSGKMAESLQKLRNKFQFLSDTEIVKLALSNFYKNECLHDVNGFSVYEQKELDIAINESKKGGLVGPFEKEGVQTFLDSIK